MKPIFWEFYCRDSILLLRTPWFGFLFSFYAKDVIKHGYSYGVTFFWKRNKNIKEGDEYFQKHYRIESDFLNYEELLQDAHLDR